MEKIGKMQEHSTRALFFIGGFGAASWAPLVPVLRERLAIGEDVLGMLLLCIGIGSVFTMPISGSAAAKFGCRKVLTFAGVSFAILLFGLCTFSSFATIIPTLFLFGAMMGCIDVVVNVQAVIVEKFTKKRLMSGFHALWSVGGFIGAGLFGIWVGIFGLSPMFSTAVATLIMLAVMIKFSKYLLSEGGEKSDSLVAIPRGTIIFIGVIAFISFLSEGAVLDWSGVFLTTVKNFDISLAGVGFSIFSAAMLIMRLVGDKLVQAVGQKLVVFGGFLFVFLGFVFIIFAESSIFMYAGFFLIGIGTANIVPIFFSMLGRQKIMPVNMAVSAVTTMGYLGILVGPAIIGFVAHWTSLYFAFGMLAFLVIVQSANAIYVYRKNF